MNIIALVKLSDYNLAFKIAFFMLIGWTIYSYIRESKDNKREFGPVMRIVRVGMLVVAVFWLIGAAVHAYIYKDMSGAVLMAESKKLESRGKMYEVTNPDSGEFDWKGLKFLKVFSSKSGTGVITYRLSADRMKTLSFKGGVATSEQDLFTYMEGTDTVEISNTFLIEKGEHSFKLRKSGPMGSSSEVLSPSLSEQAKQKMYGTK